MDGEDSPSLSDIDLAVIEQGFADTMGVNVSSVNITSYDATPMQPVSGSGGQLFSIHIFTDVKVSTKSFQAVKGNGTSLYATLAAKLTLAVSSGEFLQVLAQAAVTVAQIRNISISNRFENSTITVTIAQPVITKISIPTARPSAAPVDTSGDTTDVLIGAIVAAVAGCALLFACLYFLFRRQKAAVHPKAVEEQLPIDKEQLPTDKEQLPTVEDLSFVVQDC